jgi:hypothetical protein
MTVTSKEDAVRSVVMDYVEGWFKGDMGRMIDATADGEGCREDAADRRIEIRIDYLSRGIAGVQCFCHCHVDLLHLIDMQDGWKIVNAAWRLR